jgi:signal transduction histidine kinase
LTSVKLLIQRAAERQPVHSLNSEQTAVLLEEISRMECTVQSLLDFARPEKPRNVACELSRIVTKSLALLEGRLQQRQIEVHVSGKQSPLDLYADPLLIQQVIVNIVINAIDFMPDGGTIRLQLERETTTGNALLRIQDSGPGIDPMILERIFEPFVTTRTAGSGLGLAISRRVIEELGGTLTAANSPDKGALFQIRLPLAYAAAIAVNDPGDLLPAVKET